MKKPRGAGSFYRRGNAWWICYWVAGQPRREAVSTIVRKPPHLCTQQDAEDALALRVRQKYAAGFQGLPVRRVGLTPQTVAVAATANTVMGPIPIVIDTAELQALAGPIVYAYFRSGQALYVGMSSVGLARPFNPCHPGLAVIHPNGRPAIAPTDHLVIWPCSTVREARELERRAIESLKPTTHITSTVPIGGPEDGG